MTSEQRELYNIVLRNTKESGEEYLSKTVFHQMLGGMTATEPRGEHWYLTECRPILDRVIRDYMIPFARQNAERWRFSISANYYRPLRRCATMDNMTATEWIRMSTLEAIDDFERGEQLELRHWERIRIPKIFNMRYPVGTKRRMSGAYKAAGISASRWMREVLMNKIDDIMMEVERDG